MSSAGRAFGNGERSLRPFAAHAMPSGTEFGGNGRAPAFIAVAHGSRDPRSAATMSAVVAEIARQRPDVDVRLAFLDLNTPSVEQVIDAVAAQGHTEAVVVPLLLGSAFHARVDLPGMLAAARHRHPLLRITQADVLGTDARLVAALRDRAFDAGADRDDTGLGIAVAAVGSSSAAANRITAEVATALTHGTGWRSAICFATAQPSLTRAVADLRSRGARRVMVAPWFLAPGLLIDRLADAEPGLVHAPPIGPHRLLTEVALDRYHAAGRLSLELSA